jgi:lipopolysaccharide/colanic/teichoic acid biosynthesis glycosyltransferase
MKRLTDVVVSIVALVLLSPLLLPISIAIWAYDRHSPFYVAPRMTRGMKTFRMVKFRSMVKNADKSGVDSTGANDSRITGVGKFIRRYKIDELPQLWNVLKGEMSLVGPRPNVEREVRLYSDEEQRLLSVRPGITDLASIVFADEGDILADKADPDIAYNQLIRPGKSRLGLFYVDNHTTAMDVKVLWLTVMNSLNQSKALAGVAAILTKKQADPTLCRLALREDELVPTPPPGRTTVVTSRDE